MAFPFLTLPELALYAGNVHRNPSALGYRRNERWHRISSQVMLESIRQAGEGLIRLGLQPGDKVGIAADSSPFWLMGDLAALGAGAVTVPLFPNAAREVLRHQITDSGMRFLLVGSPEIRDALLPLCSSIEHLLVLSPRLAASPAIGAWTRDPQAPPPADGWDARAAAVKPEDTATLIYTSGSTGSPKGVELTHANIVSQIQAARIRYPLDPARDKALSFLPLSHIFERMVSLFYVASGVSLYFAEDPRHVGNNLRELRPTLLTAVPRFLEKAHDQILSKARESGGPLRVFALAALGRALSKPEEAAPSWKDRLYERLVYRRLRARMGGRLRLVICGSAALDSRLCLFFVNCGVPVYEGYGLTESAPVLTVNDPGHRKIGTVGRAFSGVELRIAPDGEVLARGPNIMKGYYGHPEETAKTVDADGWLYTGDLGRLDAEGYLTVTGRKKELFKTANGKYVAPVPIEQALTAHPLVDGAVVIAEGRPYASVLIFPDFDGLLELRRESESGGETEAGTAFLRSRLVQERFAEIIEAVNAQQNSWERLHRFCLADTAPGIETGELTPTQKIRRHAVEARYAGKIEAMYNQAAGGGR